MAKVVIDLTMSLDGFITGPNPDEAHGLGTGLGAKLHDWYFVGSKSDENGEFFQPDESSAKVVEAMMTGGGAAVIGRKLYDITGGWGGNHPVPGLHCFVVTHHPPAEVPQGETKFTFVTEGVESAIAQAKSVAGDREIGVAGANVSQQALKAGLVDELMIHLVPLLLGDGVRLFEHLGTEGIELEIVEIIPAKGVTHLRYRVLK